MLNQKMPFLVSDQLIPTGLFGQSERSKSQPGLGLELEQGIRAIGKDYKKYRTETWA